MATLNDLLVTGSARFIGPIAGTITKALQDGNGNTISSTYLPVTGGTLSGLLKFSNALTQVSSPTVVATFIGNDSKNGIGYASTSALSVGYATSAGAVAWGNVTGKPTSFTPSSHNHSYLAGWGDTRNVATTPNDYNNKLAVVGIKTPTASGTLDGSSYSTLMGIRGWGDSSGGNTHELAFTGNGALYHRHGATTSWNAWKRIPFGDGTGASGTWGINVTGSAGSVAWANVTGRPSTFPPNSHTHSYLPVSGGSLSGPL
jgi:hypothetical protein